MISTRWIVITGAPCSGKTAVIVELEKRGHRVVHEVARAFIEEELSRGLSLSAIKADLEAYEKEILERRVTIETRLPKHQRIFLDRALPDCIAYYKMVGLDFEAAASACRRFHYQQVFHFERLTFQSDPVRSEDEATASTLDQLLEAAYGMLGYTPERVPVLPINQRIDYLIKTIGE